jgi:uncharacterized protein YegL
MDRNKYVLQQEAIDYPGRKLPVVFCIDVSNSMKQCEGGIDTGRREYRDGQMWTIVKNGKNSLIDAVKERVNDFHLAMQEDKKSSVTCQTAYITFGDNAKLIEDFGVVKDKKAPIDKLIAKDDNTYICDALEMALKMLDEQKQMLYDMGNRCYIPWLIILTDGRAHDDPNRIKKIKKELLTRQNNDKLIVYTLALNDDPELYQQIRGYSAYKPIPYDKAKEELKRFFKFLKNSISSVSNSKISDKVKSYSDPDDYNV